MKTVPMLESIKEDLSFNDLSDSIMELSYFQKSDDGQMRKYESKNIKIRDLTNILQKFYNTNVNLSGDFYVNKDNFPNTYCSQINSYQIEFNANELKVNSNGIINNISVINTPANNKDAVNLEYLINRIKELKTHIDEQLNTIQRYNPPYLTFVLMDRLLSDNEKHEYCYEQGGVEIQLNTRPQLQQYINDNKNSIKTQPYSNNDTWFYELKYNQNNEVTAIILPYSESFVQFVDNSLSVGIYMNEQLPNISGDIRLTNGKNRIPLSYSDALQKTGSLKKTVKGTHHNYWGRKYTSTKQTYLSAMSFNASRSNPIYKDGSGIQPRTNFFIPYFYIGPEVKS